ncbi:MAG: DmsE family decaheme c-type cytochrome [Deltaproteobacteria bacterium]|nr:DmsE family decaheme c-type cytochrome [Deltaproteobacteria bacterium]
MRETAKPVRLVRVAALAVFLILAAAMLVLAADGGGYVGSEKCKECHEAIVGPFRTNIHSKTAYYGAKISGCESCHGPAAEHVKEGDKTKIVNPAKIAAEAATAVCASCHSKDKVQLFWKGSAHDSQEAGCVACHKVHGGKQHLLSNADEKQVCFGCHGEVRATMLKRSKHPMRDSSSPTQEGKMGCSACHNPHGARSEKLINAKSVNDKCYECHAEKKAPVLWEHSPVKEDCLTCHAAHGSSFDKMLVQKAPRLCQQCHMQGRHQTGTLSTNSAYAINRSCLNCHPMIHGSNNPSGPVLQR